MRFYSRAAKPYPIQTSDQIGFLGWAIREKFSESYESDLRKSGKSITRDWFRAFFNIDGCQRS